MAVLSTAWLLLALWAGDARADNAQAIADFGVERGAAINEGFFFSGGEYVEGPYVAERRGLDVFINGICARRGPEYPPFVLSGEQDPGTPPPGSSPLDRPPAGRDPRDTYWTRKWAYLKEHFEPAEAVRMMMDTYRTCASVMSVEKEPGYDYMIRLTMQSGRKVAIDLAPGMADKPSTKEEYLAQARRSMAHYEEKLRSGRLFFIVPGGEMAVSRAAVIGVLEVLASDADGETKRQLLEEKRFLKPNDPTFGVVATGSKVSPQLISRLAALKEKAEAARRMEEILPIIRQMEQGITLPEELDQAPYTNKVDAEVMPPGATESAAGILAQPAPDENAFADGYGPLLAVAAGIIVCGGIMAIIVVRLKRAKDEKCEAKR